MKLWMWLAWKLPRGLAYWCAVRVISRATTGKYSSQIVPELSAMDALKRWGEDSSNATAHRPPATGGTHED